MKAVIQLDHEITNRIRTLGQPTYRFWKFMAADGIYLFLAAIIPLALFDEATWLHILLPCTTTYLVVLGLQLLIRRQRPNYQKLTGYRMWIHTYSHPSAHAAVSASLASGLSLLTSFPAEEVAFMTILGTATLAIFIGISRIVVGVHYAADVFFGWIVGFIVAFVYAMLFPAGLLLLN